MNPVLAWIILLAAMGGLWLVCLGFGAVFGFALIVALNGFSERQAFPVLVTFAVVVSVFTGVVSGGIGAWIGKKWLAPSVPAGAPVIMAAAFSLALLGLAIVAVMPSSR